MAGLRGSACAHGRRQPAWSCGAPGAHRGALLLTAQHCGHRRGYLLAQAPAPASQRVPAQGSGRRSVSSSSRARGEPPGPAGEPWQRARPWWAAGHVALRRASGRSLLLALTAWGRRTGDRRTYRTSTSAHVSVAAAHSVCCCPRAPGASGAARPGTRGGQRGGWHLPAAWSTRPTSAGRRRRGACRDSRLAGGRVQQRC